MRVMTANVRNADRPDDGHSWERRKAACARVIASTEPDVLGLQEAMLEQVEAIAAALPEHRWYGLRQAPGEHPRNAVLVHRALEVVDRGGYWLSPTPHVPGSFGWDAAYPRHANWIVLQDALGSQWRVINTHLDHKGERARANAVRLLAEDGAAWPAETPQLLMGDFNTGAGTEPIAALVDAGWRDTWAAAHPHDPDPGPTRHGFGVPGAGHPERIDWILARGPSTVRASDLVRERPGEVWPSDHFFLWADVKAAS